jgi:hypothetical protein
MARIAEQPLLFLDVDGTVIPFSQNGSGSAETARDAYLARIDPELGRRLAALPCELAWATTWEEAANTEVAPRVGTSTIAGGALAGSIKRGRIRGPLVQPAGEDSHADCMGRWPPLCLGRRRDFRC